MLSVSLCRCAVPRPLARACDDFGPLAVVLHGGDALECFGGIAEHAAVRRDERDARAESAAPMTVGFGVELRATVSPGAPRPRRRSAASRASRDERRLDCVVDLAAHQRREEHAGDGQRDRPPRPARRAKNLVWKVWRQSPVVSRLWLDQLVAELLDGDKRVGRGAGSFSRAGGRGRRRCACRPCSDSPRRRSSRRSRDSTRPAVLHQVFEQQKFLGGERDVAAARATRVAVRDRRRCPRTSSGRPARGVARCARRSSARTRATSSFGLKGLAR